MSLLGTMLWGVRVSRDGRGVLAVALASGLVLSACAQRELPVATTCPAHAGALATAPVDPRYGVAASPRVGELGDRLPRGGGVYKVGKPYQVAGRWYFPREEPAYDQSGVASWYGTDFHARKTANGEVFDMNALTAAHPTLPLPSYVSVTNLQNGRTVLVRVNDRGPYVHSRLIDLSRQAAR